MRKTCRVITTLLLLFFFSMGSAHAEIHFSESPDLIEESALSIVRLTTYDELFNPLMQGSGFLFFNNITLVTNYHVIENATLIIADSDDDYRYFITDILIADKNKDLAILRFMAPTVMKPLEPSVKELKRGEKVVAIGSPEGLKNTVSIGNISSIYRENEESWIQFTAPISHGSSGGALFNDEGKVIGVTSASFINGQNINLAININEVLNLWQNWDGNIHSISEYPFVQPSNGTTPIIPEPTSPPERKKYQFYVSLTDPSKIYITMMKNDSIDLSKEFAATLKEIAGIDNPKELAWFSYNENAIDVSDKGVITALLPGGNYTVIAIGHNTVHFYIKVIPKL